MNVRNLRASLYLIVLLGAAAVCRAAPAVAQGGMVATVQPLATTAGVNAMKQGGNAIDAAVAAALTLGVVDGHNSGIGGGCFILIHLADGSLAAIDGREMAPIAAHRDMYLRDGKADGELSTTGPLASGVPGALAAYAEAIESHGRLPLRDLLRPAADIAENGFPIDQPYADKLARAAETLARFPGARSVLLRPDGSPLRAGQRLRQPDLAHTYRAIAEHGAPWFYRGPFAERVGAWMADNGGIITADDFADYKVMIREPLISTYRGHTIIGFPPPSSGGVHVAQILNTLERFNLAQLRRRDPAAAYHVAAEAMKLAFADRAYWLGDPDFANVPRGLMSPIYGRQLARKIKLDAVTPVPTHGTPPGAQDDFFGRHTTHVAGADDEGNWVAITATVNTTFGSKVIVPGTGVILNNQMDDFSIQPGVPNAFGLIGAQANQIEPGKRPLSSMSPTIVIKDGRPVLTVGAAGGPKIITQVLQTIVNRIDFGMSLEDAVAAPRIHHQWSPDELVVETTIDQMIVQGLQQRGHKIERTRTMGITQAIAVSDDGQALVGVHDPRIPGRAAGPD